MIRIIIVMILIILIVANIMMIMIIFDQTPLNHDHCRALDNHHSGHATPEQLLSCWSNQMPRVISSRPDSCIIIEAAFIIIIIVVKCMTTMMMQVLLNKGGGPCGNDDWCWQWHGKSSTSVANVRIDGATFFPAVNSQFTFSPVDLLSSCFFQQCQCALLYLQL